MKIRLNENEVYEIKLPEEIGVSELTMIASRFNTLIKNFSKISDVNPNEITIPNEVVKTYKKQNKKQIPTLKNNRALFVELLNTYYNKNFEEFETFKNNNNFKMSRAEMSSMSITRLKELHNVNPNEIGLIKFPSRNEQIKNLRIDKDIENKYEVGIIHYDINGKYSCNQAVNSNKNKLSKDVNKITCDNCKKLLNIK